MTSSELLQLRKWDLVQRYNINMPIFHLFIYLFIHSFIYQWLYSLLLGSGLFFSFVIISTQSVGLLGRVISLSQGHYLQTGQHKHRINAFTDIHALSGIRTHDPRVRASKESSCHRPSGYCDRQIYIYMCVCVCKIWFVSSNYKHNDAIKF
jgi:hypothetical protein